MREPNRFDDGVSCASDATVEHSTTYQWAHDLGEILTAVLSAGLRIEAFGEHRSMPWRRCRGWSPPSAASSCRPGRRSAR